ncbi:MAG: TolC family protein [Campylobacterota bacterium]|nr:TolC family protein [Campylobacterota bacterium]
MLNKKILLLFLPLVAFSKVIDFQDTLSLVLENNMELKAKKLNVDEAKSKLTKANSYDFGTIIFNENISRSDNPGYVIGSKIASREAQITDLSLDALNGSNERTNYETKISYDIPLFTGFKIDTSKQMAKLQILAQKAKYSFDEKQLELEVLKAYNGAVVAKEFIEATNKAKETTLYFINLSKKLYNEGLITDIDVMQSQVHNLNVDASTQEAKNKFDLSIAYLQFLTNDIQITDVNNFAKIEIEDSNLQALQNKALNYRDDLNFMQLNVKTMKNNIELETSDKYPTIGIHLEYGLNNDNLNYDTSTQDYYVGAIGIKYTLFDGGLSKSKKQIAKIKYKKAKVYYEYMKQGINLEVEKNILTLQAKQKIFEAKEKAVILAKKILKRSKIMYKNYLINMSNLLTQQTNLQKARADMIKSKFDVSIAVAKLKLSYGNRLKELK